MMFETAPQRAAEAAREAWSFEDDLRVRFVERRLRRILNYKITDHLVDHIDFAITDNFGLVISRCPSIS